MMLAFSFKNSDFSCRNCSVLGSIQIEKTWPALLKIYKMMLLPSASLYIAFFHKAETSVALIRQISQTEKCILHKVTESDVVSVCFFISLVCFLHCLNSRNINGLVPDVHVSKSANNQANILYLFCNYLDSNAFSSQLISCICFSCCYRGLDWTFLSFFVFVNWIVLWYWITRAVTG